jgi:hypothetical protein
LKKNRKFFGNNLKNPKRKFAKKIRPKAISINLETLKEIPKLILLKIGIEK